MSEPEAPRVTRPRGSMDMDASIWSELPFEMVGHVLSFLLLRDVCRNRTVCRKWNQLILSDKFAALHGQHARRRRGPSFTAMNMRYRGARIPEEDQGVWCCLDLSGRRCYDYTHCTHSKKIGTSVGLFLGFNPWTGGLVCRLRLPHPESYSQHLSIIVNNVKGLRKVTLPEIARHLNTPEDPKLLMVADSTSFKIFLINHDFNDPLLTSEERLKVQYDPLIHVYDSGTCEWKSIDNTAWVEHWGLGYIMSIVMYQGFWYVIFLWYNNKGDFASDWRLLRYNLSVESWENVDGCTYSFITSLLVVSNNCLFLVLWCEEDCSDNYCVTESKSFFEVREIRTRDMTQETVLKLSAADVRASFDIKTGSPFGMIVIGFESSLFFMSHASGNPTLFDLVTRSWDHGLPSNPLAQGNETDRYGKAWIGKHMNLLLPWNTDW